jgi:curved DNA-binding protein CbpA
VDVAVSESETKRMGRRDRFYTILGLSTDASDDEVKKAYRTQAMRWHPDKNSVSDAPIRPLTSLVGRLLV